MGVLVQHVTMDCRHLDNVCGSRGDHNVIYLRAETRMILTVIAALLSPVGRKFIAVATPIGPTGVMVIPAFGDRVVARQISNW